MSLNISVVVPTYNRKDDLKECLESLLNQDYSKYEIIVVDDGSIDGTEEMVLEMVEENPDKLKYFKQKNKGPAAARNLGIKKARGDIIAFTDSDCVADRNWLDILVSNFTNSNIGAVGGQIVGHNPKTLVERFSASYILLHSKNIFGLPIMATANAAYRKKILEDIGLFDETVNFRVRIINIVVRVEDADLSLRVTKKGYTTTLKSEAKIYHKHRTTVLGLFKQFFGYGCGDALLFKKYKSEFGKKYHVINLKAVLKTVSFFVPELPWRILTLYRRRRDKVYYLAEPLLHLVMHLGLRSGRLYGSIKFRVICL